MTTEEKAKAYDEALERARKIHSEIVNNELLGFPGQIEDIFPQLRESDDERIRKMCITAVNIAASADGGLLHSEASECLSWLEEQKDKNCLACDQHLKGYIAGRKVTEEEKQKEQKPDSLIYDKDLDKAAREFYLSGGADSPVDSTGLVPIVRMAEFGATWMKERMEKEQKSAEVDESTKRINKNWMKQYFDEQKQEYPLTPDECIKPTEWSEIEVEFRGEKVKVKRPFFRDDKGRGYSTTEQDDEVTWNALRAWAESHGHTPFELYPKEEWSEEDERMLSRCIKSVECSKQFADSESYKAAKDVEMNWLNSLRPSWKPSEEQMEALEDALEAINTKTNLGRLHLYQQGALGRLYQDLKKL